MSTQRPVESLGRRYPGARSFDDSDAARRLFFGREKEKARLKNQVLADPLVVVFGQSGYGKTSLIKAGLLQPLREQGYFPVVCRINDEDAGPLHSVFHAVREAADAAGHDYVHGDETSLWHFFKTQEVWSGDALLTPVMIIDQFEELFSLHDEEVREQFIDQFSNLVRGTPPPGWKEVGGPSLTSRAPKVKVVLSLRSDKLAELEALSDRIPQILRSRFSVGPLRRDAARRAIVLPGQDPSAFESPRFEWDEAALDRVLNFLCKARTNEGDAEGDEVEAYHLQLICQFVENQVVNKARQSTSQPYVVTDADLGKRGNLDEILTKFYARSLLRVARRGGPLAFLRIGKYSKLCERGLINARGNRLSLEETDIGDRFGVRPDELGRMVNSRLLRGDTRRATRIYELSHDTLVKPVLSHRGRRRSRIRVGVYILSGLLIVLFGSGWLDGRAARADAETLTQARDAYYESNDAAAASLILREVSDRNLVWAKTVSEVFSHPFPLIAIEQHQAGVRDLDLFSGLDGRYLLSGSEDGTALLWNLETDTLVLQNDDSNNGAAVRVVAASADGQWFAFGGSSGQVFRQRTDGTDAEIIAEHEGIVRDIVFFDFRGDTMIASVSAERDGIGRLHVFPALPRDSLVRVEAPLERVAGDPRSGNLAVASRDGTIRWFNRDGHPHERPPRSFFDRADRVRHLQYDPGPSGVLLVVGEKRGAHLVGRSTHPDSAGWSLSTIPNDTSSANNIVAASFGPEGKRLILMQADGVVRVVRYLGGGRGGWEGEANMQHPGRGTPVAAFVAQPTVDSTVPRTVTAWSDGSIRVWEPFEPSQFRGPNLGYEQLSQARLNRLALSADGRYLATGNLDGTLLQWDLASFSSTVLLEKLDSAQTDTGRVDALPWVSLSDDRDRRDRADAPAPSSGRYLRAEGDERAFTVLLGDSATEKPLGSENSANVARFNADGSKVVVVYWDETRVFDLTSGAEFPLRSQGGQVRDATFNPGSNDVVTTSAFGAEFWEYERNRYPESPTLSVRTRFAVAAAEFRADGTILLTERTDIADDPGEPGRPTAVWAWSVDPQKLADKLSDGTKGRCLRPELRQRYLREAPKRARETFDACTAEAQKKRAEEQAAVEARANADSTAGVGSTRAPGS